MQLPIDTLIAGKKNVGDWNADKIILSDHNNHEAWERAYADYFLTRLDDRYLKPINSIKQNGSSEGEGFSMMAVICSLVEFLEGTYQGTNFKHLRRHEKLKPNEYSSSSGIFISFLTQRPPFNAVFNNANAKDFYEKVRCGLLHEARTKGKWRILASSSKNIILDITPQKSIIYRNDFFTAIKDYIKAYKTILLASVARKSAFIRKYDNLCKE